VLSAEGDGAMRLSSTEPQTYRVYALLDPVTKVPHYVGQTAEGLGRRLSQHVTKHQKTRNGLWVRALIDADRWPEIVLLEEFVGDRRHAYEREAQWIKRLKAEGCPLLN